MGTTLGKCVDSESVFPFFGRSPNYRVLVKTGDKKNAGTDATVRIRLYDVDGQKTEEQVLDVRFRDDFERGNTDEFYVRKTKESLMGRLQKIELWRDEFGVNADWYVEKITIEDPATRESFVFPVHRWIPANYHVTIQHLDCCLPKDDLHPDERARELAEIRKLYELRRVAPNTPVQVKQIPDDENFSHEYQYDMETILAETGRRLLLIYVLGRSNYDTVKQLEKIYGKLKHVDRPPCIDHWFKESWFGAQRLMSSNPTLIQRATEIPERFGVTDDMVKARLEGLTIEEAIRAKRLYITDLGILEGIEGTKGRVLCKPFALFFHDKDSNLLPVAIQLYQDKGQDNPVFTPDDDLWLWRLAKLWYNGAETAYHQALTHLGFTHLKMESVYLAVKRTLSPSHPIFKLVAPHFLYLIAINWRGLNELMKVGGVMDSFNSFGAKGTMDLIAKASDQWRMDQDLNLKKDLKKRGVDDPNLLPFYPYRDDAILIWDAIEKYVRKVVGIYYDCEDTLLKDQEVQNFARDLVAPSDDGGVALKGIPGNGKFEKLDHLIEVITCTIFGCSVGHAAANFPQYDDYAFAPNYPSQLLGKPPTSKEPKTEKDFLDALPCKKDMLGLIGMVRVLSSRGANHLGDFEITYLYHPDALHAAVELRNELVTASKKIRERNKSRKFEYPYLDPVLIPNSISI